MATANATVETESLTSLHWVGVALAALTGLLHLALGVQFLSESLGPPFILAGLGFFGGIALFLLDVRRDLLYPVGVAFTAVQFVAYFVLNWPNVVSPLGLGDKVVQLGLVAILVILWREE